jgi:transposase-like protein
MPRRRKDPDDPTLKPVAAEILDEFVHGGVLTAQDIDAAMRRFKKALIERALGAELTHHLGYAPGAPKPEAATNHRNGRTAKTVLTDDGAVDIDVPRDRQGTFEPVLLPKHERRFTGFDDKILALYARGLTVREIQAFLHEMYGRRGLGGSDQHRDRRDRRGGDRVAGPPAGPAVCRRVL